MILSLVAWLAMWGQAQTPDLSQLTDPGIVRPLKTGPHVPWDEDPSMLGDNHAPSKPAEHVIEIKTRRVPREVGTDCNYCDEIGCTLMWCQLPTVKECKEGETFSASFKDETWGAKTVKREHYSCDTVTRELWIDGVRWGVVKGLD